MKQIADFREGDVLNFKGKSIFSQLIYLANYIHYGEKGYSHTAIIGEVKKYSIIVYEALNDGFVKSEYGVNELKDLIKEGKVIRGHPKHTIKAIKRNCEKYLSRSYGWLDIFHISLYIIFNQKSFIFNTNSKSLICSEAVSRILYDASNKVINFEKEFNKDFDLITPHDLFKSEAIKWY